MNIITKERFEELCAGFVQHVFNETQTKGWTQKRSALFAEHGFSERQYEDEDDEDEEEFLGTFQDIMMTKYDGDLDKTLEHFFYEGPTSRCILRRKWFACYCVQQCPEIKEMLTAMTEDELGWKLDDKFKTWFWRGTLYNERENAYYTAKKKAVAIKTIKDTLGLDICLK